MDTIKNWLNSFALSEKIMYFVLIIFIIYMLYVLIKS